MKKFKKVEKTGIISSKFSLRCTPSVILGPKDRKECKNNKKKGLQIHVGFHPNVGAVCCLYSVTLVEFPLHKSNIQHHLHLRDHLNSSLLNSSVTVHL